MRDVLQTEELEIPEGVTVDVKSRLITVTGPRGTLTKNVRHISMDIQLVKGKANKVTLAVWQGGRKHVACLRTIKSLIVNLITGVTKARLYHSISFGILFKYCYRDSSTKCVPSMPISPSTASFRMMDDQWKSVTSWAKRCVSLPWSSKRPNPHLQHQLVRHVNMLDGVTVAESKAQKDELILVGNDVQNVSQSAASIQGLCKVRNKDIRKFLDGEIMFTLHVFRFLIGNQVSTFPRREPLLPHNSLHLRYLGCS